MADAAAEDEDSEDDYGLIRPSLIKQLRAILDQYPDDGQILKEIIQNAEDAGAKEVKFLYDHHQYGTESLHHPELAEFQGPALYAYNNAVFRKEDWKGIRMLQDSIKVHDPMKVGRFGLGFKSVLHMTDLPSVLSADGLFMIDPHEKHFKYKGQNTSGYRWHLKEKKETIESLQDQFQPFKGLFSSSEETFEQGYYGGTMFRFPLRSIPSELSDTLYSPEKMSDLLLSFEKDAHMLLVFLKNIENIQLYERKEDALEPTLLFEVGIAKDVLAKVQEKRRLYVEQVLKEKEELEAGPVSVSYMLEVETVKYLDATPGKKSKCKWLVNEYHAGAQVSSDLLELQHDKGLALDPVVGAAMEVPTDQQQDRGSTDTPTGQVFCFLPLPIEQESSTGLPVHLNGYFAISQNRRDLKWPTKGQNIKSDKSLLWNKLLLEEVLPRSYCNLILDATKFSISTPSLGITPEDVYKAWPSQDSVGEKWRIILPNLLKLFLQHPIFFTEAEKGRWIQCGDALFNQVDKEMDAETESIVANTLLKCKKNVVKVPDHVFESIERCSHLDPQVITPTIVRDALQCNPAACKEQLTSDEKLVILNYILDGEDFLDYFQELSTIHLLPLANGEFVPFGACHSLIYIPTRDCIRELFPGMDHCLLAGHLKDELARKLDKLAMTGCTRLRHISKECAAELIKKVIPSEWYSASVSISNCTGPSANLAEYWLPVLWEYLRKQYPRDTSTFDGLPILPYYTRDQMKLLVMNEKNPRAVLKESPEGKLDCDVARVLEVVRVCVVDRLPDFVQGHAAVIRNLVKLPLVGDVLKVLCNVCQVRANKGFVNEVRCQTTTCNKQGFLRFLCGMKPGSLTRECLECIKSLPLFQTTRKFQGKDDFASVNEVSIAANVKGIPGEIPKDFLDISDPNAYKVAQILSVKILSKSTILKDFVLPTLVKSNSKQNIDSVVCYIFDNHASLTAEDPQILDRLGELPFLSTGGKTLHKPCSLFDPECQVIKDLFQGQNVFPVGVYARSDKLVLLRKLGLKSKSQITADDLLACMKCIDVSRGDSRSRDTARLKGSTLLQFLGTNADLLEVQIDGKTLADRGRYLAWVPAVICKPDMFPQSITWPHTQLVVKPEKLRSKKWIGVVGLIQPIAQDENVPNVSQIYGWMDPPGLDLVASQLEFLQSHYSSRDKAKCLGLLTEIYEYITDSNTDIELMNQRLCSWVWHGDGFTSPEKMVRQRHRLDLSPYLHTLPSEMEPFIGLFSSAGMKEVCAPDAMVTVLSQIHKKHCTATELCERQKDLQMSIDILNCLTDDEVDLEQLGDVCVPIKCAENELKLLPIEQCTYCDEHWLRQGFDLMEFDEISFIHPFVPVPTASAIGVPTLMSRMLHLDTFGFEGFGQGEPLTTRLKNLLRDYTDGLAIFKELIQNADDAGATEVKFMYDERTNQSSSRYLIDEGMKDCQGPALWAFNNAVFTDDDLKNITKLGGATKQTMPEKIGKFGLGFNAVYNVTDVPSFVSRSTIVVLDPHTTHLGKSIQNRLQPGIKLDMQKNKTLLAKLPDQFRPYQGIFGFKSDGENGGYYDGTLFRLPLRTKKQSIVSEISDVSYSNNQVWTLLKLLAEQANDVIMFTQKVNQISVYHVAEGDDPQHAKPLYTVCKELESVEKPANRSDNPCSDINGEPSAFFERSMEYMGKSKQQGRKQSGPVPETSYVLRITFDNPIQTDMLRLPNQFTEEFWFVSTTMGSGKSLLMEQNAKYHCLPIASVAFALTKDVPSLPGTKKRYMPAPFEDFKGRGRVFCYLPLPIQTGLPININAGFALESSRRYIMESTSDDKDHGRGNWNKALMEDAIFRAYILGLQEIQKILPPDSEVTLTHLWPTFDETESSFHPLVKQFYQNLSSLMKTPVLANVTETVPLEDVVFLERNEFESSEIWDAARDACIECLPMKRVMHPVEPVLQCIRTACHDTLLLQKVYSMHRFYEDVFFPNIEIFPSALRDTLVIHALQHPVQLASLLQRNCCIPTSPDGTTLSRPSQLVSPQGLVSKLYLEEDGRFPHGEKFTVRPILEVLGSLGMKDKDLEWEDVVERVQSIADLYTTSPDMCVSRRTHLLDFLDAKLNREKRESNPERKDKQNKAQDQILKIPFLPVLSKPSGFPLQWKYMGTQLMSSDNLYPKEYLNLVGSVVPVLDHKNMTHLVKEFLRLSYKLIETELVLQQLENIIQVLPLTLDDAQFLEFRSIACEIYEFLQNSLQNQAIAMKETALETICQELEEKRWILVGKTFVQVNQVAMNCKNDCSPMLYTYPDELRQFKTLMKTLGVKEKFQPSDFIGGLQKMKNICGDKPMTAEQADLSVKLVIQLNESIGEHKVTTAQLRKQYGTILIPDAKRTLQPSDLLCFNDCPWMTDTQDMNFIHPGIPYTETINLGIKTKKEDALQNFAVDLHFGQSEKLTTSLKRILKNYPCDHSILKELIQNADDAGATEIHFVLDTRHHPKERVFGKSWEPLQGPALCVYNNKPFTSKDLEGIQNLGEGSKKNDPSKIGQYGIGFSSVYHLTDAPSVLTDNSEIGSTLCIFDPHSCFTPRADKGQSGQRYKDVERMRDIFPDVFSGYLQDVFSLKDATLCRFPLRNYDMREKTKISGISVSEDIVDMTFVKSLLQKLQEELFDILLFTKHIVDVSISEVDNRTGKLANIYNIKAKMSDKDRDRQSKFTALIDKTAKSLVSGAIQIPQIQQRALSSSVSIEDNTGFWQKWQVVQVFGIGPETKVSKEVMDAFQTKKLLMMPLGGAACLLEQRKGGDSKKKEGKAFCFLPLPITTGLPVHINGHFALFENRRQIWSGADFSSYTKAWNDLLTVDVIAPAYAKLLMDIRMHGLQPHWDGDVADIRCRKHVVESNIRSHYDKLPSFHGSGVEWHGLVQGFYESFSQHTIPVLPLLRKPMGQKEDLNEDTWQVVWLPPNGKDHLKAFFYNKEFSSADAKDSTRKSLLLTLLGCGLNLLTVPNRIETSLKKAGVSLELLSPESVVTFFKTCSTNSPHPNFIENLPMDLACTPFGSDDALLNVLSYCCRDQTLGHNLDGLPLLLTQNGILRAFDSKNPIFVSEYNDLLPERGDLFLNLKIKKILLESTKTLDMTENPVCAQFRIKNFAELLHEQLPEEQFKSRLKELPSDKNRLKELPSDNPDFKNWLKRLWAFFLDEIVRTIQSTLNPANQPVESLDKKAVKCQISSILQPLSDWCLIPAEENGKSHLVPVGMCDKILNVNTPYLDKYYGLAQTLCKLTTLQLDASYMQRPLADFITRYLVTSLERPLAVLQLLYDKVGVTVENTASWTELDCNKLLMYFCEHCKELERGNRDDTVRMLRALAIYTTIGSDRVALNESSVYLLPSDICTVGIDVWQQKRGIVFLKGNEELQSLFKYIGCAKISYVEAYCDFILKHLEYFSAKESKEHLHFVYKKFFNPSVTKAKIDKQHRGKFISTLRSMDLVESRGSDSRQQVEALYDPEIKLFKIMLTNDDFPTDSCAPFVPEEWLRFLREIGLVSTVSSDTFISFAKRVALEGRNPVPNVTQERSKTLVNYLLGMDYSERDKVLQQVKDIPFIAPAKASLQLQKIHPQRGELGSGTLSCVAFAEAISQDYEQLVWTSAYLLPDWADPRKQEHIKTSTRESLANSLDIQLSPRIEQVLSNLLTLCSLDFANLIKSPTVKKNTISEIFKETYRFLAELKDEHVEQLGSRQCILVEDGTKLVLPKETVLNMRGSDEIRPYLYRLPTQIAEFEQLFLSLGTTETATTEQFASVLAHLKKKFPKEKLPPNALLKAFKAVRGILEVLENNPLAWPTGTLYLPTEKGKLVDASALVVKDSVMYLERIEKFNFLFLFDITECGFRASDGIRLLSKLPQKPSMLSAIVYEELVDDVTEANEQCDLELSLNKRIKSEKFRSAVTRLVGHDCNQRGVTMSAGELECVHDCLSAITVCGVGKIVTRLRDKRTKHAISGSEMEKTCYTRERKGEGGAKYVTWEMLVQNGSRLDMEVLMPLSETISRILPDRLHDFVLHLLPILQCEEDQMEKVLDIMKVSPDMPNSASVHKSSLLPVLGTPLDDYDKAMLDTHCDCDPAFEKGEYVGYRKFEDSSVVYACIASIPGAAGQNVYRIKCTSGEDTVAVGQGQLSKFEAE